MFFLHYSANEHFQQQICLFGLMFFLYILVQLNISANEHFQQKMCSNGLMFFVVVVIISAIELIFTKHICSNALI